MNRLRMERRANLSSARREVERIGTRIKKLLNLMLDDEIAVDEGKAELKALDARRKELQAQLETADEPAPLLHPGMAELYRYKVTTLAQALEHPETRTEATEALRGLIDAIVMTPAEGTLRIELKGNLAAMLGATVQSKRAPETEALSLQVSMVAGARNQQYLEIERQAERIHPRRAPTGDAHMRSAAI
jgi:site-specific DNA recombinase